MKCFVRTAMVLTLALPSAHAIDHVVDAAGVASSLTTIEQAMQIANPGDRILVMPGDYPAFHFSRGVDVIGLGDEPGDVRIDRVDFHPNIPNNDFEAGIQNVEVCPDGGLSGNELSSGTLTVQGAKICGGVFLHGAGDLYVLFVNSDVVPDAGDGFLNAAMDLSGGTFDIVDTRIHAPDASNTVGSPAGIALRVGQGSVVRISGSEVSGGDGLPVAGFEDGGDAIVEGFGAPVDLRLSGDTLVAGGHAAAGGAGGTGVTVNGLVTTGDTNVIGGSGSVPGASYGASPPAPLGYDPHLRALPSKQFAENGAWSPVQAGFALELDSSLPAPLMVGTSVFLETPQPGGDHSPLDPDALQFVPATFSLPVLGIRAIGGDPESSVVVGLFQDSDFAPTNFGPDRQRYFQAFFRDPTTGSIVTTNPIAVSFVLL